MFQHRLKHRDSLGAENSAIYHSASLGLCSARLALRDAIAFEAADATVSVTSK